MLNLKDYAHAKGKRKVILRVPVAVARETSVIKAAIMDPSEDDEILYFSAVRIIFRLS
jgi:hypothetical protein